MASNLYKRLEASRRRVDAGMKLLRAGRITREEFEARKAEMKDIGDAVIADQLVGLAEARIEREQSDWSEGRVR